MIVFWIILVLIILIALEAGLHRLFNVMIPVRILISGTTGRTSVARMLAAALKTQGKVLDNDAIGFFALFRPSKAFALVVVCPSANPFVCSLYRNRVRPTVCIVTNASENEYETSIVPEGLGFYTSDLRFLADTKAILVAKGISEREKNEALAVKVLTDLGFEENHALGALSGRTSDPVLEGPFDVDGRHVINACDANDIKTAEKALSAIDDERHYVVLLGSSDLISDQLEDYARLFTDYGCQLVVVLGKDAPKQARILANNVLGCKVRLFKGTDSELISLCDDQILCIGSLEDRLLSFLRYCRENGTES